MTKREHLQSSRVAKKVNPGQPGTKKQLKIHGDTLVCVRYRHDGLKLYRFTTVELVTDAAPIHRKRFDLASFGIHIDRHEGDLRAAVKAAGARWDPTDRLWWLRGAAIRTLDLVHRIRKIWHRSIAISIPGECRGLDVERNFECYVTLGLTSNRAITRARSN